MRERPSLLERDKRVRRGKGLGGDLGGSSKHKRVQGSKFKVQSSKKDEGCAFMDAKVLMQLHKP
jgi:hypothetical protein